MKLAPPETLVMRIFEIAEETGAQPREVIDFMLEKELGRVETNSIPLPCVIAEEWDRFREEIAARRRAG